MTRAKSVCPTSGCATITEGGRCGTCRSKAEQVRGSASQRGYNSRSHRIRFRQGVLSKHPFCVLCGSVATVADHHPLSRRELEAQGLDPNDPERGRGLCKPCHDRETSTHQPGGWNQR